MAQAGWACPGQVTALPPHSNGCAAGRTSQVSTVTVSCPSNRCQKLVNATLFVRCKLHHQQPGGTAVPQSAEGAGVSADGSVPSARKSRVSCRADLVSGMTCSPATPGRLSDCVSRGRGAGGWPMIRVEVRHPLPRVASASSPGLHHAPPGPPPTRRMRSAFHCRTAAACAALSPASSAWGKLRSTAAASGRPRTPAVGVWVGDQARGCGCRLQPGRLHGPQPSQQTRHSHCSLNLSPARCPRV